MSFALSTLWFEKGRYLPGVLAVTFSAVLIAVQFGLLLGLFSITSLPIDESNADVWVGPPKVPSVDLARTIPADAWAALEQALVLTPSSYGLQPWKFFVVTDPAMKAQLPAHSWGQRQPQDCSHMVVLAIRANLSESDIDRYVARVSEVRGQSVALAGNQGPAPAGAVRVHRGQQFLDLAWWMSVFPGMAICVAVLGFNLFADGLTEMFNPRASAKTPKLQS